MKEKLNKFFNEVRTYGTVYLNTVKVLLIGFGAYFLVSWITQWEITVGKKMVSPLPVVNIQAQNK